MDNTQYFYRTAVFTRKDNKVALADIHNPNANSELDGWMGVVISLADGAHTIQELIGYMSQQYQLPPSNLEETLRSVLERLEDGKLIKFSEAKIELPYYLASPIEELDIEKAKTLMIEDGYQVH